MVTKYPAGVSMTSLDGTNGFTFTVQRPAHSGSTLPIASSGDFNGDGFDDLLIGWWWNFLEAGQSNGGGASVVFGSGGPFPTNLTPSSLNGKNGFTVVAPKSIELFGRDVASAGDVNGDGIDDFILGSDDLFSWSGAAAVVFGTKAGVPAKFDAGSLNGSNGFLIGTDQSDLDSYDINLGLGRTVASAGDVNGDGYGDLIIGAPDADTDRGFDDGSAVILFGKKAGFPSYFNVSDINGANGFRVIGAKDSETGTKVTSLGDINGDGLDDIWIGGSNFNLDSHVVFGRKGGFGTNLDLTTLNGRDGFTIASSSVSSVGDLNGDGLDDFAVEGKSGTLAVVFGKKAGYGATLNLDGTGGFVIEQDEAASWSISSISKGDINGDGIDDLVFAGGGGLWLESFDGISRDDRTYGYGLGRSDAYVVFGKKGTFAPSINVSDIDGTIGFKITGLDQIKDNYYLPVVSADGDLNGDGVDDIVVSRGQAEYSRGAGPEPVHVIYGGKSFIGATRNGTAKDETLTGTKNNDALNGLDGNDRLLGAAGDDRLDGGRGTDRLEGGAGDDRLDGGSGVDRLEGGAGDDTFLVDTAADTVIEAAGAGLTDTVVTTVSYALTAGQEIEILRTADRFGRSSLSLTGNEKDNVIFGNAGANILSGGGGRDILMGGGGNDVYAVNTPGRGMEIVAEFVGAGHDTVVASVSFELSFDSEVETLQLATRTGKAKLDLTGNEFAQVIRGNGGSNVLDGGVAYDDKGGDDSLYGRGGDDILVVRRGGDKAYELAGEGKDAVVSYVSYALAAGQEIETLRLHSNARVKDLDLTGNEFANTLVGFDGKNVLDGRLGADVLTGRKGADTFVFSTKLGGGNVDHITDFASEDTIRLSKSVFTALGTGPLTESAFKVIGSAGADADDRILYKQATGEVFYDADGSGSGAATLFAVLDNRAALTAGDFLIA